MSATLPQLKPCFQMQTEATKHLKQTITDDSVKLIVLTGTGEYFTSGADFLTTVNADSTSEEHIRAVLQTFKYDDVRCVEILSDDAAWRARLFDV